MLIDGFVVKFRKSYDTLKMQYNDFINDLSASHNEYFALCMEYQELYFGNEEYIKNYKKYESDIDVTLENERKFFLEINFGCLLQ